MHDSRLGDEIDDFCIKCKRLTNHAIVSLLNGQAAKVRCRTCYHDHDFRHGEPLPSKKELAKLKLLEQSLAEGGGTPVVLAEGVNGDAAAVNGVEAPAIADAVPVVPVVPVKKGRKKA